MEKKALTMNIEQVLVVKMPAGGKFNSSQNAFRQTIENHPEITSSTYSRITPGDKNSWVKGGIAIKGIDNKSDQIYQSSISPGFFDFFGIKLIAGQQFFADETNSDDGKKRVIINKEAALALGSTNFEDVLGKMLYDSDEKQEVGEIIGIVDGYFQNSLEQKVLPTIFNPDQYGNYAFLKIKKADIVNIVSTVKSEFQKNFEGSYFEYFFLDDYFNKQYLTHIRFNRCFVLFSIIALIISSLSLLGVVMMVSTARTKEIGIRKVNGAKIKEILYLINKEFLLSLVVAFIITTPIIWFFMTRWLENFAYKTELSWWIFALAGLLALGIALLTVSFQSWKAATRNPVEALRYE
jgi:putative ABC transport system permease protein